MEVARKSDLHDQEWVTLLDACKELEEHRETVLKRGFDGVHPDRQLEIRIVAGKAFVTRASLDRALVAKKAEATDAEAAEQEGAPSGAGDVE